MSKLWERKLNETTDEVELKEVALDKMQVKEPTVIFLSGFSTLDREKGYVAGAIKRIEEMLGFDTKDKKPVNIFAWSHKGFRNLFNMVGYHLRPKKFASKAAKTIAGKIMLPLVSKDITYDEKGQVTGGTPLPLDEAKANLKNVTLFGYSAGTVLAQETYNAALNFMTKAGYEEEQAKELLHEVVLISAGNMSRPGKEKNRFTTLYLAATNDKLIRAKNRLTASLKEMFRHYSKKLRIKSLSKVSLHISAPVRGGMREMKKDKEGNWFRKKIDLLYPNWLLRRSYHELPHYVTHEDRHNKFSKIAIYALTNSVQRKERPKNTEDLLQPAEPFPGAVYPPSFQEDRNLYQLRIKAAMKP